MSGWIYSNSGVFWQPFGFMLFGSTYKVEPPQKVLHLHRLSALSTLHHSGGLITTTRMTTCDASFSTSNLKKKYVKKREKPRVGLAPRAFWNFFFFFTADPLGVRDKCVWTAGDSPAASDIYCRMAQWWRRCWPSPWYRNPLVLDEGGAAPSKKVARLVAGVTLQALILIDLALFHSHPPVGRNQLHLQLRELCLKLIDTSMPLDLETSGWPKTKS